jgi:hypothetical protein
MRSSSEIGVLDIDFLCRQLFCDIRKRSRTIVVLDHQHFVFYDQSPMCLEYRKRFVRITDNHSYDCMIDRIGDGQSENINLRFCQCVTNSGQSPRLVFQKQG